VTATMSLIYSVPPRDRRSLTFDGYGVRAARKRGLMMRYPVARHPGLQRDMGRLAIGLQSVEGGKGGAPCAGISTACGAQSGGGEASHGT
jgi:hypothetical protein